MSNVKSTPAARAKLAAARANVRELAAAEKLAAAAMREARSAANKSAHAARPVPVSVGAVRAAGLKGENGTVTVSEEVAAKFVSLRAFVGTRVRVAIVDGHASVTPGVKGGSEASAALKRATSAHAAAARKLAAGRARVATLKGTRAATPAAE